VHNPDMRVEMIKGIVVLLCLLS